jgi:Phosphotransferase enzyme family
VVEGIEVLRGGVANAGAVIRVGDDVLRPAPSNSATIHRFLRHVRRTGGAIVPEPESLEDDGRERLRFIPGDVPVPPYPGWAQSDEALASVARLIRALHLASRGFAPDPNDVWSTEMADPQPRSQVVCHNDVCLENVVFQDRVGVALLDFDFAAPGRPTHDLACFARMCVPVDDEVSRGDLGWSVGGLPDRLRLIADVYGCTSSERREIIASLDYAIAHGGQFVQRHAAAGEPGFVEMWASIGGMARFDRRRDWWARCRGDFAGRMRP